MAKKKKYAVLPDGRRIEVTGMSSQQTKKLNKKATTYEAPVKEVKITDKSDMGPVRTTVTTEADRTNMSLLEKMKYGIEKNPWMPHGSLPDIYRAPSTDGRTWFDKGALDDGYQLGDITKTILGTGADVAENVSTAVMGMGEKAADFMTYLAPTLYATQQAQTGQVVDLSAQDKMRKDAGELIKKDLYNEEKIAKTIITKPLQKVGIDAENESVFGEKSDALIQSAGQLLATAGLQAVGVPWWLTTGTTSFGSETENALNQGATYEEAGASALISAGAEILTEQLSGGISFGGKTLDDVLTKQLATKISSKTARHLAKFGLDAFGEGTEEVVSQIFSNLGSSLYKEEDTWELLTNEDAMEEYLESFIGGAVLGGGSSGINIIKNAKKGTDAVTGLNANEQKVADKEIENRIKESEKDGKKLSSKEKAKIRNQVYNDLDKGYISIDTIESVLGGDTYNKYRELNDRETSLQEEFDHLNKMKQGDMTGEQVDRRTELKQQLADLKASSEKGQIKDQLTKEVQEMVKSDRLMESYNEKTRRSQAYEADITKYDEKQQAVIKKAAESGILNNTNRTHEFVDMIAKISADKGVLFDFTNNEKIKNSGFAMEGKTVNGYIKDGAVTLNINSAKALNKVVGHEITHVLEGTELYSELQNAVKSYAETKGEYSSRLEAVKALYEDVEGANVENELTADLVGDYLFTDENFVSNLSAKNPNIFKKIYDEIKYLVKVVTAGSKEARELEKVKRTFEKAYKETANAQSGTKYMLQKEVKNVAERLSGREWNQVKEAISNYNNLNHSYEKSSDGDIIIPVDNKLVYTDGDYDSPGINKVIEFDSDTETEIDEARRMIYEAEKGKYTLTDAYEIIEAFTRDGFINEYNEKSSKSGKRYDRRTSRGKSRSDSYHAGFLQERIGRANEIIGNVNNSQEASSEGDVFFDGEKKTKFSLAGTESRTADTHSLTMARQMAENGDSELEVYQKTGWYQGADGKWRFEIDDSEMKVDTSGKYSRNPDIRRYQELMEKVYFSDTGTKAEENELRALDKNLKGVSFEPKKLDEIMQHPKLFEAYPELREIDVRFVKKDGFLAAYHPGFDEIAINTSLRLDKEKLRKAITHEVQHAIQTIEGFAGGANTETWNGHIIPKNDSENLTDFEKYEMTAGEIEAREAAKRMDWSKEERLSEIPTRETEHGVIFAENKDNPFEFPDKKTQFSVSEKMMDENDIGPVGGYNIYGKDIALEQAAAQEDIAPVKIAEIKNEPTSTNRVIGEDLSKKKAQQIRNIQAKIEGFRLTKDLTAKEFNEKINSKKEEYANLTRKNTKKAVALQEQIINLKSQRDTLLQELDNKIEGHNKAIENIESRSRFEKRQTKQQEYRTLINDLIGDTSTWKDKKTGIQYQVNTLQRNLRDIVRDNKGNKDIARADAIYDELQGKYNLHEAELNRESNAIKKVFSDMNINDAEDTYIQMLGEFRHNPATTLTQEDIDAFYNKYKRGIDVDKVNTAIDSARELYDSLFVRLNEVLSEQGMKEIPYRKGYFPHFIEDKQGIIAKIFNWKVSGNDIPTDIAGLTETFNPQRSWQSFNKRRTTDDTDYSFKKGLDTYLHGALDWIYHIEDIQKRRVFEQEIRYRHSEKGLQEEIDNIRNNPLLSAEEAQKLIDDKFAEARNPLNNFITDFRNATNNLAGKKSTADRGMEYMTNRTIYSVMTNVSNRVNANMVGGSVSSALTNFIPIVQSWGAVNPVDSLVAMKDTMKAFMKDDGMIDKSAFMTNRLNASENLYKSGWDRFIDKAGFMMEAIDSFTTQTVWRSKYAQNIKEGMSEQEAIKNADRFAEGVMAGRSRGNMPTIFNSKNPLTKLFTSFQLEAANQFGYLFKDLPQDVGRKSIGKLAAGYATVLIASRAYNMLYSMLTGRDAALDPLGILEELWSDLGSDDEEKEKKALLNLGENVVEELPFIGGLFGGGRTPISSAIPYDSIDKAIPGMIEDVSDGNWSNLGKEWLNPVYYLGAPVLGGQIKKINEGLGMFNKKHPVPGSYTQSGNLRFPVEDTLLNRAQAAVFGQYANKNARYYFDNNIAPLKEKQIEEYKELDVPIKEYWDYREGLKEQKKTEDKFDYIADLDLPISKKNIMINNAVNRKEKVDLTDYHKFEGYEEFDFYTKNKEKYEFLKENNISYEEYQATDEAKENYDDIYSWYKNNPDKVAVSKAVTSDVVSYKGWTKELYDIRADKDSNGKSISGTAKEKKIDYINGLDIDYGAKLVLFKSQYKADDTYNSEIIDYLNEREDISAKERKTILKELGFTVDSKGNARW